MCSLKCAIPGIWDGSEVAPTCTSIAAAAALEEGSETRVTRRPLDRVSVWCGLVSIGGIIIFAPDTLPGVVVTSTATSSAALAGSGCRLPSSSEAEAEDARRENSRWRRVTLSEDSPSPRWWWLFRWRRSR